MNFDKNIKIKYQFQNYDSNWAKNFKEIKLFLQSVFGKKALKIEHFGSTAVPGMKAKPVVDIVVVVGKMEDFLEQRQKMIFLAMSGRNIISLPRRSYFIGWRMTGTKQKISIFAKAVRHKKNNGWLCEIFFALFPKKRKNTQI
jgi:GrpB-like predicted nucleotidyltransferase (UPF0157 family)